MVRRMTQSTSPTSDPKGKVNESEANSSNGVRISYSVNVNPQVHLDALGFLSGYMKFATFGKNLFDDCVLVSCLLLLLAQHSMLSPSAVLSFSPEFYWRAS